MKLEAKSVQVFIDQDVGAEDSDSAQETGFPEMGRQTIRGWEVDLSASAGSGDQNGDRKIVMRSKEQPTS
ncbi:MAG: hypothetical protein HN725_06025 [Alphaproteobacteria bacterium]|nr:hypothetical protein [Alphaproteobacteria bacterium]MBT4084062.1 hypothetical protein [Alphaproteobacteria bacterium]MBT4545738.1 hypothetical protein [Alphaproteobacteria bacterium]MBT7744831.1 hypothetical protein [Alphaproteobacteria bacterium]